MALFSLSHPDVSSGGLLEFGFHKVIRQTKSVIINMLNTFFSNRSKAYGIAIPEVLSIQNSDEIVTSTGKTGHTAVYNVRDFPYTERKFPMVLVATSGVREKKPYIGADDLKMIEEIDTSGGRIGVEVYGGMVDIDLTLIVVSTSPDERSRLVELIAICFSHYYRGQFIYYDEVGNMFSITPATKQLDFGAETEVKDESTTTMVYITDLAMSVFIEYHFIDVSDDQLHELKYIDIDPTSGII
jgi:hypothetical protein